MSGILLTGDNINGQPIILAEQMINSENYRSFPAVSNSDLGWLKKYWQPSNVIIDLEKAYAFGNLIDAIITEPNRVNYYKWTVDDKQYTKEDFDHAIEMRKAFYADKFCQNMVKLCSFQRISYQANHKIQHEGFDFSMPCKAKWDLFCEGFDMGGDIKSTAATTQKQFEDACWYFDYYRSRAWYMDLEGRTKDVLIGISKKNNKVFKIHIEKGASGKAGEYYRIGKQQYQEIAFKYWYLFMDFKRGLK